MLPIPGVPLLAESNTVSTGDPSSGTKEYCPPVLTSGTADLGEKGSISGMNNAGIVFSQDTNAKCSYVLNQALSLPFVKCETSIFVPHYHIIIIRHVTSYLRFFFLLIFG